MKLGCCTSAQALTGGCEAIKRDDLAKRLEWFAENGFDYLELGVSWLAGLEAETFDEVAAAFEQGPLTVDACNLFLRGDIRLVGPDRSGEELWSYLDTAFARVRAIGCPIVVFGSGRSRTIPEGFDRAKARDQLHAFLTGAAERAQMNDITIVIEPLRREESNVINTVREGAEWVEAVGHPNVQLLADSYHMEAEDEPLSVLSAVGGMLRHAHTADTERKRPGSGAYDHLALFRALQSAGYDAGLSIECKWDDFDREAPLAAAHLRRQYAMVKG